MKRSNTSIKPIKRWTIAVIGCCIGLLGTSTSESVKAAEGLGGPSHLGTFEGSTTFTTSSSNGINPGLYLEVMDSEGNYTEYTSEDGIITVPNTREGAYVTQAKLLGKTKYRDQATGEFLDEWDAERNLTLESVQRPVLTTIGNNLINIKKAERRGSTKCSLINNGDGSITLVGDGDGTSEGIVTTTSYIHLKQGKTYTFSFESDGQYSNINGTDTVEAFLLKDGSASTRVIRMNDFITTFVCEDDGDYYVRFDVNKNNTTHKFWNVQLTEGSTIYPYEPYQSNILSTSEDVVLRGIRDVRDTLDLNTGEVVERISSFKPTNAWSISNELENTVLFTIKPPHDMDLSSTIISDKLPSVSPDGGGIWDTDIEGIGFIARGDLIRVRLLKTKASTHQEFQNYLQSNPITVQYQLKTEFVKTVGLNSTYYFDPVLNRDVRVNGTIVPLVASVTIPTEPLSFIIDPNQDEGQELVAPEFSITNQTPGSIYLNLKAFEQTTNVLNDVLPTTYPDWHQLDKHQSKDIALALVPKPSDGWMSLTEGPRYVADPSNYELGVVKAKSTVDFTFSALHGRTFVEELNPQYRLSFEFGF